MIEFLTGLNLWALLLSAAIFQGALVLKKKTGFELFNPILVSSTVIIIFLIITGTPNSEYQAGMKTISWLMTPATVCLAIPLYTQLNRLRGKLKAIIAGIFAGTITSLAYVIISSRLLHLSDQILLSMLPKSVTTALAIPLSESSGGFTAITTASVMVSGFFGNVVGSWMCKVFGIRDNIAMGAAFGTASHVVGTSRATQIDELCGAVSSLSIVVAGLITAVLYPIILKLI